MCCCDWIRKRGDGKEAGSDLWALWEDLLIYNVNWASFLDSSRLVCIIYPAWPVSSSNVDRESFGILDDFLKLQLQGRRVDCQ